MTHSAIAFESYQRATSGQSVMNYQTIFDGFKALGIDESEIKPRENILTYNAWKALGRHVCKGQHGVKAVTFVAVNGKETEDGKKTDTVCRAQLRYFTSHRQSRIQINPLINLSLILSALPIPRYYRQNFRRDFPVYPVLQGTDEAHSTEPKRE